MRQRSARTAWLVGTFLVLPTTAIAQGTRADYERANSLRRQFAGQVLRDRVIPHWYARGDRFWYRNDLGNGEVEYIGVDAVHGIRGRAFDHDKLAKALARLTGAEAHPRKLVLEKLAFNDKATEAWFVTSGKAWHCDLTRYELREQKKNEPLPTPEVERDVRPTGFTGPAVVETLENRTGGRVHVYWCREDSQLRNYGSIDPDGEKRLETFVGHVWVITNDADQVLAVVETPVGGGRIKLDKSLKPGARVRVDRAASANSPDGVWSAVVVNHNVFARNLKMKKEVQLSKDGTAEDGYTGEFVWSPDSNNLVAVRTKNGQQHDIHLIESSPKDQFQPRLHTLHYLKPGDRIPIRKPRLFDVAGAREIPIDDALFPNPWETNSIRWEPDGKRFAFLYNQRGHQLLRIIAVEARTGRATVLIEEQSKTFIDYAQKYFLHPVDDTGEVIWMSERDGWNHLYRYDARAGKLKNQITRGEWVVRGVDWVDERKRQIWFRAGGIRPGQDPYLIHHARVNFDGTGLTLLTEGDGTHEVVFSPDHRFLIDTYSRVDRPPVIELRRADDGKLVCALEQADISRLKARGWRSPEPFVSKGRDGRTDIHGIIFRPLHFDAGRKYPVIENVYAGPQSSYVPKRFEVSHAEQSLAELGFIVVRADGMGTSNRSRAFHDVCWKNLGDGGFPDRIAWIKAAAAKYPSLDLTRVGIYGGSAGGQNALRALLAHGDFYKAAVADCGCHDNRMDKIWWNELWMGWPVGPEYAEQSNVTNAHKLQGKLLLIVGELDRNVDPASTMQVVNALVKSDKDFDLLVVPGAGHGAAESPYGQRRRQDFFVRHLLRVEPRSQP
jgi:dipeptidyl aminopeptidase/acylaminoacyl peptidase